MNLALACGLLIACGSQSRVDHVSHKSGGGDGGSSSAGSAGTTTGGANSGGSGAGGVNAGSGNASRAGSGGSAGIRIITGEPDSCVTTDGAPGILVDVFPLPEGPRLVCEALNQPGNLEANCPSDVLLECSIEDCYEARTMQGCCRPDGYCGLLDTGYWGANIQLGCISRDPWIQHGEEVLNRPVTAVRCD